jgi:hypothetical protein
VTVQAMLLIERSSVSVSIRVLPFDSVYVTTHVIVVRPTVMDRVTVAAIAGNAVRTVSAIATAKDPIVRLIEVSCWGG